MCVHLHEYVYIYMKAFILMYMYVWRPGVKAECPLQLFFTLVFSHDLSPV